MKQEKEESFIELYDKVSSAYVVDEIKDLPQFYSQEENLKTLVFLTKNPELIENNYKILDDVELLCCALRLNPICYKFLPLEYQLKKSVISTTLTAQYFPSEPSYNKTGLFSEIKEKENLGYLYLALLNHPYVYNSLSLEQRSQERVIIKLMLGLSSCELNAEDTRKTIENIPLQELKKYLKTAENCKTLSNIVFKERTSEALSLWNSLASYLMKTDYFSELIILPPSEDVTKEKISIENIHIHFTHHYLTNNLNVKPKSKKINKI